ncbi:Hypothetical protein NTJ_00935 [Nesidiocoris tenuis]|uniref:Uncharacterized protein n=1 Tax=Nesidiocoris tenuis TaxID=355587 RepID=A0ABN7AA08_9HEMI|nr:Hypothetical protein NTJ_00935 [Nesidiocoris tenuis]
MESNKVDPPGVRRKAEQSVLVLFELLLSLCDRLTISFSISDNKALSLSIFGLVVYRELFKHDRTWGEGLGSDESSASRSRYSGAITLSQLVS